MDQDRYPLVVAAIQSSGNIDPDRGRLDACMHSGANYPCVLCYVPSHRNRPLDFQAIAIGQERIADRDDRANRVGRELTYDVLTSVEIHVLIDVLNRRRDTHAGIASILARYRRLVPAEVALWEPKATAIRLALLRVQVEFPSWTFR